MVRFLHCHGVPRLYVIFMHLQEHCGGPGDERLLELFEKHQEELLAHSEGCIPALDGSDYWKWTPKMCSMAEFHGPMFHKGFRQYDVILGDRGVTDSEIWRLLANPWVDEPGKPMPHSENFWEAHEFAMLTTEET